VTALVNWLVAVAPPSKTQPSGETENCEYVLPLNGKLNPIDEGEAVGLSSTPLPINVVAPDIPSNEAPVPELKDNWFATVCCQPLACNCEDPLPQIAGGEAVTEEISGRVFTLIV
jgi:hypothetical protein